MTQIIKAEMEEETLKQMPQKFKKKDQKEQKDQKEPDYEQEYANELDNLEEMDKFI